MRGLIIAAPASGQGKTTVTLGLLRALRDRGHEVISAKSGPDYIDPGFHAAASGKPCTNLDSWAASPEQLRARVPDGEMLVIEGAMGLLDSAAGAPPGGPGSVKAVGEALGLPVVLVIDAARMGQSVVAIVDGFSRACSRPLAGVILNRVGSDRHARILTDAIEEIAPILGVLSREATLALPSRHLGLIQAGEHAELEAFIQRASDWVARGCDLDLLLARAGETALAEAPVRRLPVLGQRISVARDEAFGFAYTHMLEDWRAQGAEIFPFSPLANMAPDPSADAIFLPGGYPELHAGSLANAGEFLGGLRTAAARGLTIYGECGGYMTLGEGLIDAKGRHHQMAGLLPLETSFEQPVRHLGYRRLMASSGPLTGTFAGHEFHFASTTRTEGTPLFIAEDATGEKLGPMGLMSGRVMGSFAHIIERLT